MIDFSALQNLAEANVNTAGMLAFFLVLVAIGFIVWTWKRPPVQQTKEHDTTKILAETLGGIIANELKTIVGEMKKDTEAATEEHKAIVNALNQIGDVLGSLVSKDNEQDKVIETIHEKTKKTDETVDIMKTDIDKIKLDLEAINTTLANINNHIDKGVKINTESLVTMRQFIDCAKQLEQTIIKATQEMPKVEPEENKIEKPKEEKTE
jgi:methyl-accepting chemotaxis protein